MPHFLNSNSIIVFLPQQLTSEAWRVKEPVEEQNASKCWQIRLCPCYHTELPEAGDDTTWFCHVININETICSTFY